MPEVSLNSEERQITNGFGDAVRQRIERDTSADIQNLKAFMATLSLQRAALMERRRPIDDALARNHTEISATREILLTLGIAAALPESNQQPKPFLVAVITKISDILTIASEEAVTPRFLADLEGRIEALRSEGFTALEVAYNEVGTIREERMHTVPELPRGPYDDQEQRVASDFFARTGIGAGVDPIGFLLATVNYSRHLQQASQDEIARLQARLEAAETSAKPALSESKVCHTP